MGKTGVIAALLLLFVQSAWAEGPAAHFSADKEKSTLSFEAIQNSAPVMGSFKDFDADIFFDPDNLENSRVRVVINTNSITASYDEVTTTLKTPDWFGVELFPRATFEARKFISLGDKKYSADGVLTIRNQAKPVSVTFTLDSYSKDAASITGDALLKRTDFGIGQGQWSDTGAIKDDVKVHIVIHAVGSAF